MLELRLSGRSEKVLVSLGSNIEPERNFEFAVKELSNRFSVIATSSVIRTPPLGGPAQDDYLNCVIEFCTDLSPYMLKYGILRKIEERSGRKRGKERYAPRTLDLDILMYGTITRRNRLLHIPDPDLYNRHFLICLIAEIEPEMPIPDTGKDAGNLAAERGCELNVDEKMTDRIRRIIHSV
ncbi:MAG: 2-amino-4-hydroxy-6-hydroxymethyldihydropteridine diphosphokinase [Methanomassiliicoccales archaeon]